MRVIATAGHVDHGKSTLIRLLTGMRPDRWSEERRRGMTIDLGFAWTTMSDDTVVAFVDVPGHERFVPNMLAGVGPVPAVLFVIAADEGWMPQSTEHLDALHAFGVHHGVLAATRCDLADPAPAIEEARKRMEHTSLADLPVVRVSGSTGAGVEDLREALCALTRRLPLPDHRADVRLWVDRVFTIRGAGTVVTGTLPAGTLSTEDELVLGSSGQRIAVRGLQSLGQDKTQVRSVARVAVNVRGVRRDQVRRGDSLVTPRRWLSTDTLDVRLVGSASAEMPRQVTLHVGSAAVPVRVRPLGADTARLSLRDRLPLRPGDRALLRDPGTRGVASGVLVLDVHPPKLARRGAARERATQLSEMDGSVVAEEELRRRRFMERDELQAMGSRVPDDVPSGDGWLLDPGYRDELAARLRTMLENHQHTHPLEDGMAVDDARRRLGLPNRALLTAVCLAVPEVSLEAGRVHKGAWALPESVGKSLRALRESLAERPFAAPTAGELDELGLGGKELAAAVRAGELTKLGDGVFLLPDAYDQAVERLSPLRSPFTLSQARQALGTTRRVAVPLLEALADKGRSVRLQDGTHQLR